MIIDQQNIKDNYLLLLIFFIVIFFITMISIDNMILFIFITVCIFFGVGISAILRIYSRRHQRNIDTEDPFCTTGDSNQFRRNQQLLDTEFTNRNNNIFVIDVGNDTFYKGPPPPKYGEEMPPSYEDAIRNVALITTGTTTTTCTNDNITINTTNTTNITERNSTG